MENGSVVDINQLDIEKITRIVTKSHEAQVKSYNNMVEIILLVSIISFFILLRISYKMGAVSKKKTERF